MKFIRSVSVRTRLLVALLCVSIIPTISVGLYANKVYTTLVTRELSDFTVRTIHQMDAELTAEIWRYAQFIDQVSVSEEVQIAMADQRNDIALRRAIERYLIRVGYFRGLRVTDTQGNALYDDGFIKIPENELSSLIARADSSSSSDSLYHVGNNGGGNLIIGRKIFRYPQGKEHIGYIFAFINDAMPNEKVFNKVSFGDDGSISLISSDGMVLAGGSNTPGTQLGGTALYTGLTADPFRKSFTTDIDGIPSFVVFSRSAQYDTYLLVTMPLSHINEGTSQMQKQLIFIAIAAAIICVALSLWIYRSVAVPINRIISKCEGNPSSADSAYIDDSPDEIGYLARTIDKYTADLEIMAQTHTADQRRKRELELAALQYQINPHFLFNTLNTLKWVSVINDAPSIVSDGITSLSQLLSSVLMNKDEMVTVREELENLSHYFTIQRIRYADCFRVEQNVDESVMDSLIPRFILQPLVENAVLHGSAGGERQIVISVSCKRVSQGVLLEISDDGSGFDVSHIKNSSDGRFSGIGLSNVDERLKLYFGEQHGLQVISTPGVGTKCRVLIPAKEEESDV